MQKQNEKDLKFKNIDSGTKYFISGPKWEGGLLVLKPGQKLGEHFHKGVEETFYFLEGKGKFIGNGKEFDIIPGDIFKMEPGETHDIVNNSDVNIKVMFIKCPYLPADKVATGK